MHIAMPQSFVMPQSIMNDLSHSHEWTVTLSCAPLPSVTLLRLPLVVHSAGFKDRFKELLRIVVPRVMDALVLLLSPATVSHLVGLVLGGHSGT